MAALQLLISVQIILAIIRQYSGGLETGISDVARLILVSIAVSSGLVCSQLFAANLLARWSEARRPLATTCIAVACLFGLLTLIPPAAARLQAMRFPFPFRGGIATYIPLGRKTHRLTASRLTAFASLQWTATTTLPATGVPTMSR